VATSRLFRRGLLVKSGDALERLAEADTVVFDKTGTLTLGRPVLVSEAATSKTILERAASLARASRHPLARALAAAAGPGRVAQDVREVAGEGLEGLSDGRRARLGRAAWIGAEDAIASPSSHLWYREEGEPSVRFDFEDRLRGDAKRTVAALNERGLHVQMLSGDRDAPASLIAAQCGIEDWRAASDPKAKVVHLEALRNEGARTLMIGDGLNDAAALAVAHVSISPASAADASQAAADMVLTADTLSPIVEAIDVARAARRRVFENFAFSALYNALAVPLAATGQVTPLIAAVAMSASSLIVMLNALRISGKG
jgi:Cu2+-exporting ATPase